LRNSAKFNDFDYVNHEIKFYQNFFPRKFVFLIARDKNAIRLNPHPPENNKPDYTFFFIRNTFIRKGSSQLSDSPVVRQLGYTTKCTVRQSGFPVVRQPNCTTNICTTIHLYDNPVNIKITLKKHQRKKSTKFFVTSLASFILYLAQKIKYKNSWHETIKEFTR